jgi:hypothetical protein
MARIHATIGDGATQGPERQPTVMTSILGTPPLYTLNAQAANTHTLLESAAREKGDVRGQTDQSERVVAHDRLTHG